MNELTYLNIVVRCFYIDGDGFDNVEIHTYSDNWIESFVDGSLRESRRFITMQASDIPLDPAPWEQQ